MSKQVSNNPRRFQGRIKVRTSDYQTLVILARRVVEYITTNVATFATPAPALASITSVADDLVNALANNGNKYNRPSKAANLNTKAIATQLKSLLQREMEYVLNTVGWDGLTTLQGAVDFASSGYAFKKKFTKTGATMLPIRNFRFENTPEIPFTAGRLRWDIPQGIKRGGKPKGYAIYVRTGNNEPAFLANVTSTSYQLAELPSGADKVEIIIFPITRNGVGLPFRTYLPKVAS